MGKQKLKKTEANSKQTWAEWLKERNEILSAQDDQTQDSNFILHDRTSQGFACIPGPFSPRVIPKPVKQKKRSH